ncbi:exo-1,3-beta-glucanase [Serendipita sp. 396]|nr:exo-1,3-beta-glucanase [Serendipita sp. 396]KAG8855462.1 exo-1,3-beta-glucanase [Serendipita sp. 405]
MYRALFPSALHTLLLISTFTTIVSAAGPDGKRTTKCKVKRKDSQGVLIAQNPTPAQNAAPSPPAQTTSNPTSTQIVNGSHNETLLTFTRLPPFDYQNRKVRGVNLGGWFLMEPWITPSMFEKTGNEGIVDEYTFGQYQDRGYASGLLQQHWATWYTEQDFIEMASVGLNHIRLPISYWSVPIDQDTGPYITGAWPYILQALDWANAHGLYVILDLHGAPGSQNGFDNSGQRTGQPSWAYDQAFLDRTLNVLDAIGRQVGDKVEVIELLNEISGFRDQQWVDAAKRFWQAGYDRIRAAAGGEVKIMIGDAFLGVHSWDGYLKSGQGVMMDLHVYQIFSNDELRRSWDDHVSFMCNRVSEFTSYTSNNLWLVMGEWSNAITDCAKYLNGRGVGARWDGTYTPGGGEVLGTCQGMTGSYTTFSEDYKRFLRKYWETQVSVAEKVNGWVYWTWKAENADDWSYQKGVEAGFIPRNPDDRLYPNICG